MTRSVSQSRSAWPGIVARTFLAVLGGYAFTYAATAALARLLLLSLERVDALATASLLSFVVYLVFILWTFAAASVRRVLVGLGFAVPLAIIGFWPQLMELLG